MGRIPSPEAFFTNAELESLQRYVLDAWQRGKEWGFSQRECRLLEHKIRNMLESRRAGQEENQ